MRRFIVLVLVGVMAVSACGSAKSTAAPGDSASPGDNAAAPFSWLVAGAPTAGPTAVATVTPTATRAMATATAETTSGSCSSAGASQISGTYQGHTTTTFCGTARATVKIGSTTYQFKTGQCVYVASAGFVLNAGTMVDGLAEVPADGPQYFGVVEVSGAAAMATGQMGGHSFIVDTGVTIAADHMSGTVTGVDFTDDLTFTATFTC